MIRLAQITCEVKCVRTITHLNICGAVKHIAYGRIVCVDILASHESCLSKSSRVALKVMVCVDEKNVIQLILTSLLVSMDVKKIVNVLDLISMAMVQICGHVLFSSITLCVYCNACQTFLALEETSNSFFPNRVFRSGSWAKTSGM